VDIGRFSGHLDRPPHGQPERVRARWPAADVSPGVRPTRPRGRPVTVSRCLGPVPGRL